MRILALALCLAFGCKNEPADPPKQTTASTKRSAKDEEARRILILEAALEKANAELRDLEAAQPRDDAAIMEKRGAIDAVTQTLTQARRRFNEMDQRPPRTK
ncbi:MAG: hypothetical protein M3680_13100 [Myxococcota bacterium]|nr:hypothetical protein [Myxococcota bacterium]